MTIGKFNVEARPGTDLTDFYLSLDSIPGVISISLLRKSSQSPVINDKNIILQLTTEDLPQKELNEIFNSIVALTGFGAIRYFEAVDIDALIHPKAEDFQTALYSGQPSIFERIGKLFHIIGSKYQ